MRNKLILLFVIFTSILLFAIPSIAKQINNNEAVLVAKNKLNKLKKAEYFIVSNCIEIKNGNIIIAFEIDLVPKGYIIVSANTDLPPIVAYSFESNFGELNNRNPLYSIIKSDLLKRNIFVSNNIKNNNYWEELLNENLKTKQDSTFQQWPSVGNGWLTTNWTQNSPYNDFCPMDPVTNQRSIAGCPSTAMAQILNFHETTNNTHFDNSDDYYHNYAGRQYWIDNDYLDRDFPSFPELNVYLDTLNAHYLNNVLPTNQDKAAITFACGIAAYQVYTSSSSGTFGVNQAFDAYQRFNFYNSELLQPTDTNLYNRLMQNMKDSLPAHLAIVDSAWTYGHNVVVDGYNTDNYFHLNFGWGGSYNGWYLLPQEIPYNLTVVEGVIVDIIKNPTKITNKFLSEDLVDVYPNPFTEKLTFKLNTLYNNVVIKLFDVSGKEILFRPLKIDFSENQTSIMLTFKNIESGFYFYQLKTATNVFSGKVLKVN